MTYPRLPQRPLSKKNNRQTFTPRYEFILRKGSVYVRAKDEEFGSTSWTSLGRFKRHQNIDQELIHAIRLKSIVAITADEGNLNLVIHGGRVFYAKLDKENDSFVWINNWGLLNKFVNKKRIMYIDMQRFRFICASHTPDYKVRPDGENVLQGNLYGISGLYAYDTVTGEIVFSDPWWRSKFSHRIYPPKGEAITGMSVSASTILVRTESGAIYTYTHDFDTGDNPMFRQIFSINAVEGCLHGRHPVETGNYEPNTSLSMRFIADIARKRHWPISLWTAQELPPGFMSSGEVTIIQNGINVRDDHEVRVWGFWSGGFGYISKQLTEPVSTWVYHQLKKQPVLQMTQEPRKIPTKAMSGRLSFWPANSTYSLEIENFNPYKDYNEVYLDRNGHRYILYLFITTQVTRGNHVYARASLVLSVAMKNAEDVAVKEFIRTYFGTEEQQSFLLKRKDTSWELSAIKWNPLKNLRPLRLNFQAIDEEEFIQHVIPSTAR